MGNQIETIPGLFGNMFNSALFKLFQHRVVWGVPTGGVSVGWWRVVNAKGFKLMYYSGLGAKIEGNSPGKELEEDENGEEEEMLGLSPTKSSKSFDSGGSLSEENNDDDSDEKGDNDNEGGGGTEQGSVSKTSSSS